ncbi:MAG: hypothetical protein HKN29_12430 [Rhodothermales bacterium]|nr:hypothetical protein [Rhodothermales bacterium]
MRFWIASILLASVLAMGCDSATGPNDEMAAPDLVYPMPGEQVANAVEFSWKTPSVGASFRFQLLMGPDTGAIVADTSGLRNPRFVVRDLQLDQAYTWRVATVTQEGEMWSEPRTVTVNSLARVPGRAQPALPLNGALDRPIDTAVSWEHTDEATSYHLQVALDSRLLLLVVDLEGLRDPRHAIEGLVHTYPYWWRVRASNAAGYGDWSSVWTFVIERGE